MASINGTSSSPDNRQFIDDESKRVCPGAPARPDRILRQWNTNFTAARQLFLDDTCPGAPKKAIPCVSRRDEIINGNVVRSLFQEEKCPDAPMKSFAFVERRGNALQDVKQVLFN